MIRYLARALYEAIQEQERLQALVDRAPPEKLVDLQNLLNRASLEVAELRRTLEMKKNG